MAPGENRLPKHRTRIGHYTTKHSQPRADRGSDRCTLDSIRKKANFLKHVIRTLNLENIEALQIRAENLSKDPEFANSFDVIISRALSDLTPFVKSALPLLAPQGTILAMKGKTDPEELDTVRTSTLKDLYSLEVENYRLPSMNAQRSVVLIKHLY